MTSTACDDQHKPDPKNKPLIIYGDQGCGKTTNAEALAKFFGKTDIRDGYDYFHEERLSADCLALTQAVPPVSPKIYSVISFEDAMKLMNANGIKIEEMYYHDDGGLFSIHAHGHLCNKLFIETVLADEDIKQTFIEHDYSKGLGGIMVLDTDKINDDICRTYLIAKTDEERKDEGYDEEAVVYDICDQGGDGAIPITGVAFEPS